MKKLKERYRLTGDVEKEMGWWACFEENKRKWDLPKVHSVPAAAPKARVKVGRNVMPQFRSRRGRERTHECFCLAESANGWRCLESPIAHSPA